MAAVRPALNPALHVLRRDPQTVQLGINPRRAVLVHGLDLVDGVILDLFDGSRSLEAIAAIAQAKGFDPGRVRRLATLLSEAGALTEVRAGRRGWAADRRREPDSLSLALRHRAPTAPGRVLTRRQAAVIAVHGCGRVGAAVATLLATAGIGTVVTDDDAPVRASDLCAAGLRSLRDTGEGSRSLATRRVLTDLGAATSSAHPAIAHVLAPTTCTLPPELVGAVRDRPHLPVVIRETTAVIGPLVVPGRTACLRCVELCRADRDPGWPSVAAQLAGSHPDVEACDAVLAHLAAGLAVTTLLDWLDTPEALPHPDGRVLELALEDVQVRRRSVPVHPDCGCHPPDLSAGVSGT